MKVNSNTHQQLEMLHQEARLMRMYDHRNLVKLHGLVFSESDVMVVMELVSGGGLNTYLKQKKLMPLMKASFCYDIAAALAYLHANNCMHRNHFRNDCVLLQFKQTLIELHVRNKDVLYDMTRRLENCLFTTDGRWMIKLFRFGLAVHGSRIKLSSTEKVPIRWQAPEVFFYHMYLRESDVWSYGMLMSEIYNDGNVPFHDKPLAEIRSKICDPKFRPSVPPLPNYPIIPKVSHSIPGTVESSRALRAFALQMWAPIFVKCCAWNNYKPAHFCNTADYFPLIKHYLR
ncbi:hypothetical protein COOONC_18295 [Cooperia oncophora]